MTSRDLSRYHRQSLLPGFGESGQHKLLEPTVLLLGCGALGSVSADMLARAGVGHLIIVDRDFVELSLMDFNQASCDSATGGNWMYVFAGTDAQADDLAAADTDGFPGPIATDMVEMNNGTGEFEYHFAFMNAGSYRVAFTCSGEWDEDGDDYPTDPDGMFDFLTLSAAMTVTAGQMHMYNVAP